MLLTQKDVAFYKTKYICCKQNMWKQNLNR